MHIFKIASGRIDKINEFEFNSIRYARGYSFMVRNMHYIKELTVYVSIGGTFPIAIPDIVIFELTSSMDNTEN